MHLFISGGKSQVTNRAKGRTVWNCKNYKYLSSYYYDRDDHKFLEEQIGRSIEKLFMDSGGYTARIQSKDIDIVQYADFLNRYSKHLFCAANLDVGTMKEQIDNLNYLEKNVPNLDILPVIHPDEYFTKKGRDWFISEMKNGRKYIAVGGMVGTYTGNREAKKLAEQNYFKWLFKLAFKYQVKVHGFGITTADFLVKFPFFTVDSSTWLSGAKFGDVYTWNPHRRNMQSVRKPKSPDSNLHYHHGHILNSDYNPVLCRNINEFYKMEKFISELWTKRGVTFNENGMILN